MKKRIARHLLFWLLYTLVYAYLSASFPAKSDLVYSFPIRLFRFWLTECMQLPVKLLATYGMLYQVFPKLILNQQKVTTFLHTMTGLIILVLISRLITYYLAYPFLYSEYPDYEIISVKRFLYSFLDIFSAVAAAATVKLLLEKQESSKREERLQREKLIAELQFLKAQINPHFLFNTLNNIYGLARRKSDETETAVLKLSGIMRFMLYECNKELIPLTREIAAVEDYIALEKLRYGSELNLRFTTDLQEENPLVAPLLLLPFVENAFKHGASESRNGRYISIAVQIKKGRLIYIIENSTEGADEQEDSGIGLKNVRRQLDLIYPEKHTLLIERRKNTFSVQLEIQL